MRKLLSILIIASTVILYSFVHRAVPAVYYVSETGNDANSGTSIGAPWKTIGKVSAMMASFAPGDQILFKRGETFYGSLIILKSGTAGNDIVFGAYGSGITNPKFTGYQTLNFDTNVGGGIYSASAAAVKSTVNLVTVNGVPQAVGRYPNSNTTNGGYLTYESFNGRYQITDNELTSATNWTGAEVVIKKEGYILERNRITAHSGGTLTYTELPTINPNNNASLSANPPAPGFGYFIQRDARTLDQFGEWYFDNGTKTMQMHFGGGSPSSYVVKASCIDTLINIGNKAYITIKDIDFEGSNLTALYTKDASNITVQNCNINGSGAKGIFFWNTPNTLIENCTVYNAACSGIDVTGRYAPNVTVRGCTVRNTATKPGMGAFYDDADMVGIFISVSTTALIEKNVVDTVGYIGIRFQGNNVTVQKNYVNYHDFVKDDGGGIYTYATNHTGRIIQYNIILNGIGSRDGNAYPTHAEGIYCDGGARGVEIKNNTCAFNSDRGIYLNDPKLISVLNNTCFSNGWNGYKNGSGGLGVQKHYTDSIYNFVAKNNVFFSLYSYQGNFTYFNNGLNSTNRPVAASINLALQLVGIIDSNKYNCTKPGGFDYSYQQVYNGPYSFPAAMDFPTWKSVTLQDLHSSQTAYGVADSISFVYNPTDVMINIPLQSSVVNVATGETADFGFIGVRPYESAILKKTGKAITPPAPSTKGTRIRISKT